MIIVWSQGVDNALVMVGSNGRNYLNFEKIKVVKHGIFPDINSAKKWFKSTDIFKEKSLPIAD